MFSACLAFLILGLLIAGSHAPAQSKKGAKTPPAPPGYKCEKIQGFTLFVNKEVYENNDDKRWRRKPLDVLDLELGTIQRRLPDHALKVLRKILIWIEWEDKDDPDIGKAVAKYYGVFGNLAQWSLNKKKHPLKANNIEVISMKSLTREHQPGVKLERCVLLHELAHAVHHQLFGMNNPIIKAAYKQAKERKLYAQAKDVYGRTIRPTYASTNEREYFAEITCAYLDKLHYFPFNAEELEQHDKVGYKVMEKTWGTRKKLDALLATRAEKDAAGKLTSAQKLFAAGKKDEAIEAAENLINDLPDTKAAENAKKLLETWKN
jgi:hypothetical protein